MITLKSPPRKNSLLLFLFTKLSNILNVKKTYILGFKNTSGIDD